MAGRGRTIGKAIPTGGRYDALQQKPAQSTADVERELRIEAAAAGHPIPESMMIPHDGSFLRFGRSSRNAGFAQLGIGHSGHPYGVAGCFKCGMRLRVPMHPDRPRDIDPSALRRLAQAAERARQRAEAEQAERHRIGTLRWRLLWNAATPCKLMPPTRYEIAKGERLPGTRIAKDGWQMIPRINVNGEMVGGQFVASKPDAAGKYTKRYSTGTLTRGTFYPLGEIDADMIVLVCEGAITGATLHRETGHPVACAMDCGNLLAVAGMLRSTYPRADIVLAGDDDRFTMGNPGRTKAIEAARAVGGRLAMPIFCDGCDCGATDFNDAAHCKRGQVSA